MSFKIEGNSIRYALSSIKNISYKNIEKLKKFQNEYSNKFQIIQGAKQAGLNIGILSACVQSGCLTDYMDVSRSRMVLEAQLYYLLTDREKIRVEELGKEFNYDLLKIVAHLTKNPIDKPFIKESRLKTIRRKYDKYKQIYLQNSKNERLANFFYERSLCGFSYSEKIDDILKDFYPDIMTVDYAKNSLKDDRVTFGGEIVDVHYAVARNEKKTRYVKLKIQDSTGSIFSMLFNNYIDSMEDLNGGKFEEGQIVVVMGTKKDSDTVFGNKIINQNVKIFEGLADLKNEDVEEKE